MVAHVKDLAKQASEYWEQKDFASLEKLSQEPRAARDPEVLYFVGLGLNALNKKREAIECWRKAGAVDPQNENVIRTLAYKLMEQAPLEAAELFYHLVGMRRANADDLTCLGEMRIRQDRLGEARGLLEQALRLQPDNSLALLAMASLYAQVRDPSFTLDYLQKAADTGDIDLSDLASDLEYEFLWHHPTFENIVSADVPRDAVTPC